ncbi:MAG: HindIII family type II restriction endonuclease [Candidatus Gastranaerophilales bacterium]|nr:HindIII family type II restriction endonuclease [Candidatus Gastranaerophilales bacterium]
MNFYELRELIKKESINNNFQNASDKIYNIILNLDKNNFIPLITEIGSIPENIEHDSSEEKLYTKVSDIILAKCFIELGLKAEVLKERANCADVIAKSQFHNYSLVADAKAFRLSRTAKNQKDFKVESMVHWKEDNNFSVLCCPYFQYPKIKSQIYGQALNGNVTLFSWEYFSLLLNNGFLETPETNLSILWNWSNLISETTTIQNKNVCFITKQNEYLKNLLNLTDNEFRNHFKYCKESIIARGKKEIEYWQNQITLIQNYSKEEAIDMLIKSLKLNEKINSINTYINQLRG